MPRGWEGNRRSGVALAMRHGLKWFIHLWAQRLRVGDEHPALHPSWNMAPFTDHTYYCEDSYCNFKRDVNIKSASRVICDHLPNYILIVNKHIKTKQNIRFVRRVSIYLRD